VAGPSKSPYIAAMSLRLSPFSAVVFDMDGTLLDTETVFREIVFEVAGGLGFAMTDAVHLGMVGSSHERSNEILLEAYGVSFPHGLFNEQCRARMHERMERAVPVKTGARELLAELRRRRMPIAVATSSRSEHAVSHLRRAGLYDLFDTIVTRDDVANPKPHPEPYLTAARRLGFDPSRCLAVEDSHSGVRAAHAAGMQTVMVPDLVHPNDEVSALCVGVLDSLHQLRAEAFGELLEASST
jgi:HAD superfamily hydrolase (TIGR01509 family)